MAASIPTIATRGKAAGRLVERVRIGPAGWDYPDWKGYVYPPKKPRGFDPLRHVSTYFDTIEVNSTFYRPVKKEIALGWAARTEHNARFQFTAKLFRRFTHERGSAWTRDEVVETRAGLDALLETGRMGAVLLQFPWSFRNDEAARAWLTKLFTAFAGLPLALEVRHASWNTTDVLDWLTEARVGLVNIDQPLFRRSIKAAAHVTSAVGYVRLHGRNFRDWFRRTAGRDERYDYLYTADELKPWVTRIQELSKHAERVFAVTNNHPRGQAAVNAGMLESMLTGEPLDLPADLLTRYPDALAPFATAAAGGVAGEARRHAGRSTASSRK